MIKPGKGTYKYTAAKSSKVCDIDLYKNPPPTIQNKFFANGKYSPTLSYLAKEIWDYLLANGIMIIKECLPRTLNVEEDHQSRSVTDSSEWKLNPLIFKKMCKI